MAVAGWIVTFALCVIALVPATVQGSSWAARLGDHPPNFNYDFNNASVGELYERNVSAGQEHVFFFDGSALNKSEALRVSVKSSEAEPKFPLLLVVRLTEGVMSWAIPYYMLAGYDRYQPNAPDFLMFNYTYSNRTLCPGDYGDRSHSHVYVEITSENPTPLPYSLYTYKVSPFEWRMGETHEVVASPSEPQYYYYKFPEGVDYVFVKASSRDSICAVLSIQNTICPVYDQDRNVAFTGVFQTMTKVAAIHVKRNDLSVGNEFYIVVVVHPSDYECTGAYFSSDKRAKTVKITIEESLNAHDYALATVVMVVFFFLFYLVAGVTYFLRWMSSRDDPSSTENAEPEETGGSDLNKPIVGQGSHNYGTTNSDYSIGESESSRHSEGIHAEYAERQREREMEPPVSSSTTPLSAQQDHLSTSDIDEQDIDMLHDIEEDKNVYRAKPELCLRDLARKSQKSFQKKYRLYSWNLFTIAIFYALPVIQLVITYQLIFNVSGVQDLCYYNFLCANPLGPFSSFNNVFSNIGYIMLGFLYFLCVAREDYYYKDAIKYNPNSRVMTHGIPRIYGIYYAIAVALVMEGILSACYHVCPTYSNFQFDTAFMYIIAGLGMLKLYQNRHPDINPNAYIAYIALASIIFIAVLGVIFGTLAFWVIYFFVHVSLCYVLSMQIYYVGRWSVDGGIFKKVYYTIKSEWRQRSKPLYIDRMVLLIIGNVINWSLALYGVIARPRDFASFLLAVLISNLLMYLAFYVVMKYRSKERLKPLSLILAIITLVIWILALYFFMQGSELWLVTAAKSREGSTECILLDFYDEHDIWHFLSATALFLSYMVLLTIDRDIADKPREQIPVF